MLNVSLSHRKQHLQVENEIKKPTLFFSYLNMVLPLCGRSKVVTARSELRKSSLRGTKDVIPESTGGGYPASRFPLSRE
jgi:hypothetical protein